MLKAIRNFFDMGPRDPTAGGLDWSWRFALGYPFVILAACGFAGVALIAGLFPRLPRAALFLPYVTAVALFGVGLALAAFDPRYMCWLQLKEFWE